MWWDKNVFASNSEMLTQILSSSCLLNWLHSSSMCFALFSPSPRVSLFVCLLARLSVSVSTDLTGPHSKSPLSDDSPLFYRLCNPPPLTAWAFIGLSIVFENQITLSWWLKNINRQFIEVSTLRWIKLSQLAPKCASSYQKLYGYVFLQDLRWLDTTELRSLIGKVHRVFKTIGDAVNETNEHMDKIHDTTTMFKYCIYDWDSNVILLFYVIYPVGPNQLY